MADPTPYAPGYDFTAVEAGAFLNVELADVAEATEEAVAAIKSIRRSDGALKNGIVTAESLGPSAIAVLIEQVGPEGDIAAEILIAAEASALTASNAATAALASETAAAASETAADGSADAAVVSASAASASATAADGSADAAAASAVTAEASAVAAGLSEVAADGSADAAAASAVAAAASAASAAAAPVAFVANKNGTDQTGVVTATWTKVTFSTEIFDEGGHFDTAQARWTPPAGRYRITGVVSYSAAVIDQSQYAVAIYKNGASHRQRIEHASGTTPLGVSVSAIVEANGTDYFELWVNGTGAGNKTLSGSTVSTWFEGSAL
jgi:hypothetical protein